MPDIVILADTVRSPEMRRELPLAMVDPGIFIERDGTRKAWVTGFEIGRVKRGQRRRGRRPRGARVRRADRRRHVATRTRCTRS